jgi:hypothetical protein
MTSESKHKIIVWLVQSVVIAGLIIWAPFHGHMPRRYEAIFYALVAVGLTFAADALLGRKQKFDSKKETNRG